MKGERGGWEGWREGGREGGWEGGKEGLGLGRKKILGPPVCCSQCRVQPTIEVELQGLPNMHGFKKLKLTDS